MSNPNEDWLAKLIKDSIDGFNKWITDTVETTKKFAVENRHIVFPLINIGMEIFIQYLQNVKKQNQIWYNELNRLERTSKPWFNTIPSLQYYPFRIYY